MSTSFLFWAFNVISLATLIILIRMVRTETASQVRFLIVFVLLAGSIWYFFSEHNAFYLRVSAARSTNALQGSGPIELAAVWDKQDAFFLGVALAVEQINRQGGVEFKRDGMGSRRPLKLIQYVENGVGDGRGKHYEVARQEETVAVVGHRNGDSANAASLTYDNNRLFYLASTVTDARLTAHGFTNVFRSIPDDRQFAAALVEYCRIHSLKRIALLYARNGYGENFTALFRDRLRLNNKSNHGPDQDLAVTMMHTYLTNEDDFSPLVTELLAVKYDAILIADVAPRAGALIKEIRTRGIEVPILGAEGMATPHLWSDAGQQARNVVVASVMPALADIPPDGPFAAFSKSYRERYNKPPDHWASQGYESVKLLAQAWQRAGTTLPRAVGSVLREYHDWQGLYGTYGFTPAGDVTNRQVYLKVMLDGKFQPIAAATDGAKREESR